MDLSDKLRTINSFSFRWPILQRAIVLGEDSRNAKFLYSRNFKTKIRKLILINIDIELIVDRILAEDFILIDQYFVDLKLGFDEIRRKMEKKCGITSFVE